MIHPAWLRPFFLALILATVALAAGGAQKREEVLLRFSGVLKTLTQKHVVIEPDPDNSMMFLRTRRTRIIEGGKETDGSSVKQGTPVEVECVMRMNGDLEAVTVTVMDVDQSPNK